MERLTTGYYSVCEKIALCDPFTTALRSGSQQLSYAELNSRADHFAAYLHQRGILPGFTIAVCMVRSVDWIIVTLGIMRAGAAYVPLDPTWPDSRLRFAVKDSNATILVARTPLLLRLGVEAQGVDPWRDAAAIGMAPPLASVPIEPDSLAYVIYTSGTTGVPKGVEITHGNLWHLTRWHIGAFRVTGEDRASHLASLGFDAAVWEIWPNLCAGATLCLVDDEVRLSPDLIQKWMLIERVTIGFIPTIYAKQMMEMEWPRTTALRFLLTGGDKLRDAPTARLPFSVVNNYGPSECTVVATSTVLRPEIGGMPPIGRPIGGCSLYLLNEYGERVKPGTIGEIYIGGQGVGRGYRNLPDLTQKSFVPDPFAETAPARMYRTGDRGVERPDGEIEFRGRVDRQTKIRGQRVELDEVQNNLAVHPSLDFALVTVRISDEGENQLVAYVVPKDTGCVPTVEEFQKYLRHSLQDYMIPAIFAQLHAAPLSPDGKVDLTLLPAPLYKRLPNSEVGKPPEPGAEETLLIIMRELLQNDALEVTHDFFLAGGHSLLGMQLVLRLRKAFGIHLTSQQLFGAPTVERLAKLVESERGKGSRAGTSAGMPMRDSPLDQCTCEPGVNSEVISNGRTSAGPESCGHTSVVELSLFHQTNGTIRKNDISRPALPGVFPFDTDASQNSIFWVHILNTDLAAEIAKYRPSIFVALAADDFALLGKRPTLQDIASCLVRKILATQLHGPYIIGGICIASVLAYEIASQLQALGHQVSPLVLLDAPTQPYLTTCTSLAAKLRHPFYLLERMIRLGIGTSLLNLRKRLFKHLPRLLRVFPRTERAIACEMVESAAFAYHHQRYNGNVLLLLASERASHLNFLPTWQSLVLGELQAHYVDGRHRTVITSHNVRSIAEIIVTNLGSAATRPSSLASPSAQEPLSMKNSSKAG
jgi:amino acid adenylation domain-containing protein